MRKNNIHCSPQRITKTNTVQKKKNKNVNRNLGGMLQVLGNKDEAQIHTDERKNDENDENAKSVGKMSEEGSKW